MAQSSLWWLPLAVLLSLPPAGCGVDDHAPVTGDPVSGARAALTSTGGNSYLVSFTGGSIPASAARLVAAAGGTIAARYTSVGAVLARSDSATFGTKLRASADVEAVGAITAAQSRIEPVKAGPRPRPPSHTPPAAGGDPLSFRQWDMDQIRAPQARAVSSGRKSVLVGVIDSGIDVTHPDLVGQVDAAASASCVGGVPDSARAAWASDGIGHGTHVAGVIAGLKNGVGIVGVAPGVRLAAVKVAVDDPSDPNFGLVFPDAFVCALDWAIAHHFDLVNASLTVDPFTAPFDDVFCADEPDRAAIVTIVRRAVREADRKNVAVIASSGNFFTDLDAPAASTPKRDCRLLPVQLPHVIGVSAVNVDRRLSFYSDYGFAAIDLAGPGGDSLVADARVPDTAASGQVLSSIPAGSLFFQAAADYDGQVRDCSITPCATYAYLQGVSQAVPHVTGVAALILGREGKLDPEALLARLRASATPLPCPRGAYDPGMTGQPATCKGSPVDSNFYGAGEIDALAALR